MSYWSNDRNFPDFLKTKLALKYLKHFENFLLNLDPTLFHPSRQLKMRTITPHGVLVNERMLDYCIQSWVGYLLLSDLPSIPESWLKKLVIHFCKEMMYFQSEDKDEVIAGYLIPSQHQTFEQVVNGTLWSCATALDPNDPMFEDCPEITLLDDPRRRIVASITLKNSEKVVIRTYSFGKYISRVFAKEQERKEQPCLHRQALYSLSTRLRDSKKVERRSSARQLMRHGFRDTTYRLHLATSIIFVIEDGELATCYEKADALRYEYRIIKKQN